MRPPRPHDAPGDRHHAAAAAGVARAQDRRDELAGVAAEDEQREVHVLAEEAVVGRPLLPAVGRVVGPVEVEHDPLGDAVAPPLAQVDRAQRQGQPVAGAPVDGVLQARERRLAGQVRPALGQAAAGELEQRVGPQGVGVVLVGVAAGDLEDPLPPQRLQPVPHRAAPPVGDLGRQSGAQTARGLGLGQPGQAAVGGEAAAEEVDLQRQRGGAGEAERGCGRLGHGGAPPGLGLVGHPYPYQDGAPPSPMNNPG